MKQKQLDALEGYVSLLRKYHHSLDLISPKALSTIHESIDQALAYVKLILKLSKKPSSILDLGSGSGLPGVPIAIALPQYQMVLVERRKRRAAFLTIVKSQLELENVNVIHDDVTVVQHVKAEFITAQAVTDFDGVYCLTRHLHTERCCLISRKPVSDGDDDWLKQAHLRETVKEQLELPLMPRGRLVAIQLQGGLPCRLSES